MIEPDALMLFMRLYATKSEPLRSHMERDLLELFHKQEAYNQMHRKFISDLFYLMRDLPCEETS